MENCPPVTLPRFIVLRHLMIAGGQFQTDIVRGTGIDRSTLATMLEAMQRDRLVDCERGLCGDHRTVTVTLAPAGRKALGEATKAIRVAEVLVLGNISAVDLNAVVGAAREAEKVRAAPPPDQRVRRRRKPSVYP